MRGRKLSEELLLFDVEPVVVAEVERRGRSAELVAQRNELLLHRYVHHLLRNPMWKHEALVQTLVQEFFLSEVTVGEIITGLGDEARRIRANWPGERELRKRWGWLMW